MDRSSQVLLLWLFVWWAVAFNKTREGRRRVIQSAAAAAAALFRPNLFLRQWRPAGEPCCRSFKKSLSPSSHWLMVDDQKSHQNPRCEYPSAAGSASAASANQITRRRRSLAECRAPEQEQFGFHKKIIIIVIIHRVFRSCCLTMAGHSFCSALSGRGELLSDSSCPLPSPSVI
jgi:hypothetical protein